MSEKKELSKDMMQLIAGRDQAMSFIRDEQVAITFYANCHPDDMIRRLAGFALAELFSCPEINFVEKEEDGS